MAESKASIRTPVAIAATVIALWVAGGLAVYYFLPDWPVRGTLGDSFGAVNALFSGLALAGVVYAILLQQRELSLQRAELAQTREELKRSADAQERSQKTTLQSVYVSAMSSVLDAEIALLNYSREGDGTPGADANLAKDYQNRLYNAAVRARADLLLASNMANPSESDLEQMTPWVREMAKELGAT